MAYSQIVVESISQLGKNVVCNPFWLKGSIWLNDFWLAPPEQRYWQNRETANIGLVSSVGRAPARQSAGSNPALVNVSLFIPNLSKMYPVSFPCGLLHGFYIFDFMYAPGDECLFDILFHFVNWYQMEWQFLCVVVRNAKMMLTV